MHKDQEFIDKVWTKVNELECSRVKEEQKQKEEAFLKAKKIKIIFSLLAGLFAAIIFLWILDRFSTAILMVLGSCVMSFSIYWEYQLAKGDEHVL